MGNNSMYIITGVFTILTSIVTGFITYISARKKNQAETEKVQKQTELMSWKTVQEQLDDIRKRYDEQRENNREEIKRLNQKNDALSAKLDLLTDVIATLKANQNNLVCRVCTNAFTCKDWSGLDEAQIYALKNDKNINFKDSKKDDDATV